MKSVMRRAAKSAFGGCIHSRYAAVLVCLLATGATFIAGCGSGRVTIKGYDATALNDKRVFLILPAQGGIELANPADFANSRGIAEMGAAGRVEAEFRTNLAPALDALLDSNTVLEYGSQTVGAVVPMDPAADMPATPGGTWDWNKVHNAAKQGNIDYMVVLNTVRVENDAPKDGAARGKESVSLSFSLVDPVKDTVMTQNMVHVELKDPRKPIDTYKRLAEEMAKKLPFFVVKQ